MYASRTTQLIVGIFTLIGIAGLVFLSVRLGRVEIIPTPGYTLSANFDNIAGLKTGDQVELAGVKIGKVSAIGLDGNRAHVVMRVNDGVQIDSDAIASIFTSGLIGDKYVSIALGPGEKDLADGGVIRQTQSAFILENAIGQFISNVGSGGSKSGASSGGAGSGGSANAPSGGSNNSTNALPDGSNGSTSGAPNGSGAKEKQ
jgi:phospholipid/cholesterol/gamma-HCH transport system substrate-binding protein